MMSQPPNFLACPGGLEALNFYATGNRYLLRGLCSLSLRAWPIRPLLSCWMPSEGTSKLITIVSLIWGRYSNCARAFLPCRGALHCTTTAVEAASEPAPWSFCSLDWRILKDTERPGEGQPLIWTVKYTLKILNWYYDDNCAIVEWISIPFWNKPMQVSDSVVSAEFGNCLIWLVWKDMLVSINFDQFWGILNERVTKFEQNCKSYWNKLVQI